jgi:uncharacterized protein YciU (UPF0263 family)
MKLHKFKIYDYLQIYNININLEERTSIMIYIKQIAKMKIDNFKFEYRYLREFFEYSDDYEIIEFIINMGERQISEILINILNERKIAIQKISAYIVKNKEKFKKNENYLKTSAYIINKIYSQDEPISHENNEIKRYKGRNCFLFLDESIKNVLNTNKYNKI